MSKKFSIGKEIDLNKLQEEIKEYIHTTGESSPSVYMNEQTAREAAARGITFPLYPIDKTNDINEFRQTFKANQICIDNTLDFAVVEIQ